MGSGLFWLYFEGRANSLMGWNQKRMVKNDFEILAKTTTLELLFTEIEKIGEVVWEGKVLGLGHDM